MLFFDVLWDFVLLGGLFLTAYLVGTNFNISKDRYANVIEQIVVGLGIIGYVVWIITAVGISRKSLYILMFMLILFFKKRVFIESITFVKNNYKKMDRIYFAIIIIGFNIQILK